MRIEHPAPICQHDRRAAFYSDRLDALRFHAFVVRCQLARADADADAEQRALLGFRLDVADARAADIAARLHSIGAAP